jgi:hypothetical protein
MAFLFTFLWVSWHFLHFPVLSCSLSSEANRSSEEISAVRIVLAHGFDGFWLALPIVREC